jgi:hypothetical protein
MHLDPHSSRKGRLVWLHGGGEAAQYVIAGVVLDVRHEQSGLLVDIPLLTAGFEYPEREYDHQPDEE